MDHFEVLAVQKLEQAFSTSKNFVYKNYLQGLGKQEVVKVPNEINCINISQNIRLFKLNKLVIKKSENFLDQLMNFYTAIGNIQGSVILILDSDGKETDFYIGAKMVNTEEFSAVYAEEIIKRTFQGNFPGSELEVLRKREITSLLDKIELSDINHHETAIACVSGIPSLKNEDEENFVQGIERLIDAMSGTKYTAIFIADPIDDKTLEVMKIGYEELYTRLYPFSNSQYSYGDNESESVAVGLSKGVTSSFTESIGKTQSYTDTNSISEGTSFSKGTTQTKGESDSNGISTSIGVSENIGESSGRTHSNSHNKKDEYSTTGKMVGAAIGTIAGSVAPGIGNIVGLVAGGAIGGTIGSLAGAYAGTTTEGVSHNVTYSKGETNSQTNSTTKTHSETSGSSETEGMTYTNSKTQSESNGLSEQTSNTTSQSKQGSLTKTSSTGQNRNMQIQFKNRSIAGFLEQIDHQLKRIETCQNFGMWNCASYFIAEDLPQAQVAASTFKSLMRGELSNLEESCINTWDSREQIQLNEVKQYLKYFSHPLIKVKIGLEDGIQLVNPGSIISGKELALQFGLPRKSISGLPVVKMAEFGRNNVGFIDENEACISIGHLFHMGKEESREIKLNVNSLGMHTFVTGATGSGKSNTIHKLLDEVNKKGVTFLVIEPAKGEYKEVFGGRDNVNVFGTNPKYSPLLKINPFLFCDEIHILEHIDRLIEIFNACWPMYAAMPAVLKESIELAYEKKGWNLDYSTCLHHPIEYPTFKDLLQALHVVIQNSGYSEEIKDNYIGALCTRVKSLTNGLLGKVFSTCELNQDVLFDQNCIIDLSRIGSIETKSLITGLLFIKLQEYRMSQSNEFNSGLKHLTVLEEAHNLLRRTSFAQSDEGSNLQGKSVEMISNSIAEMRTYGEGFIIADQAPNLLDESVIRNTNTKIIMRLPQQEDRESVGKSISLNDKQIDEIPKLKTGVAVIYQNNWTEAVLCKVDGFSYKQPLKYQFNFQDELQENKKRRGDLVKLLLASRVKNRERLELEKIDLHELEKWILAQSMAPSIKEFVLEELNLYEDKQMMEIWQEENFDWLCQSLDELFDRDKMTIYSSDAMNMEEWTRLSLDYLHHFIESDSFMDLNYSLLQCLLSSKAKEDVNFKDFYFAWVDEARKEVNKFL